MIMYIRQDSVQASIWNNNTGDSCSNELPDIRTTLTYATSWNYLVDLQQWFSEVGVYFHYISYCGFTRF